MDSQKESPSNFFNRVFHDQVKIDGLIIAKGYDCYVLPGQDQMLTNWLTPLTDTTNGQTDMDELVMDYSMSQMVFIDLSNRWLMAS